MKNQNNKNIIEITNLKEAEKMMTEVLISNYQKNISPWFKFTPDGKTVPTKSPAQSKISIWRSPIIIFHWLKRKFMKKIREGEQIRPIMSIRSKKDKTFSEIGKSTGIIFSRLNIY
jgi:hypothetical protein